MLTDKTLRRQNLQRVKSRTENDVEYKKQNRTKAAESYHKKMQDVQYREQYKATNIAFTRGDRRRNRSAQPVAATIAATGCGDGRPV